MSRVKLKGTFSLLAAAVVMTTFTMGALAQDVVRQLPQKGKFSGTLEGGTSFAVDEDFIGSAAGTAAVNERIGKKFIVQADIGLAVESQDFSDAFDQPIAVRLGLNYGLSESSEVFGRVQYTHASADDFDYATVTSAGTVLVLTAPGGPAPLAIAGGTLIKGEFDDDYTEIAFDVGYRHFFKSSTDKFRPFASISGGVSYIDSLDIEYTVVGGPGFAKSDGSFYDDSWVFNVGLGLGFRYEATPNVVLGLETGIRYQDDLDDDDGDLPNFAKGVKGSTPFPRTVE